VSDAAKLGDFFFRERRLRGPGQLLQDITRSTAVRISEPMRVCGEIELRDGLEKRIAVKASSWA